MRTSAGLGTIGKLIFRGTLVLAFLMGVAAVWSGTGLLARRDPNFAGAVSAVAIGVIIAAASAGALYRHWILAAREAARIARVRQRHPGQPWMERADWAARRVVHSGGGTALGMWLWVAGWWGFLGLIGTVNYDKIVKSVTESYGMAALIAAFVAIGLIGAALAVKFTISWLRYGISTLHLDTLPAVTGDKFRGVLEARLITARTQPLYATLVCEEHEWVTRRRQKERETRLRVIELGKSSVMIEPGRMQPAGATMRCPIEVDVPTDLPASGVDQGGNGIRWMLRATIDAAGAPFSATFEVPVYGSDRSALP
jgi:hypothetical protein